MKTATMIYISVLLLSPRCANAFNFDVDMPNSGDPKLEMIRITIDRCTTLFKFPKKDLESISDKIHNDADFRLDIIKKAMERARSGCKN